MVGKKIFIPDYTFFLRLTNYSGAQQTVGLFGLGLANTTEFTLSRFQRSIGALSNYLNDAGIAIQKYDVTIFYSDNSSTTFQIDIGFPLSDLISGLNTSSGMSWNVNLVLSPSNFAFNVSNSNTSLSIVNVNISDPSSILPTVSIVFPAAVLLYVSSGFVVIDATIPYRQLQYSQSAEPSKILAVGAWSANAQQLEETITYQRTNAFGNSFSDAAPIIVDPYQNNPNSVQQIVVDWLLDGESTLLYTMRSSTDVVWLYFNYVSLKYSELVENTILQDKNNEIARISEIIDENTYRREYFIDK